MTTSTMITRTAATGLVLRTVTQTLATTTTTTIPTVKSAAIPTVACLLSLRRQQQQPQLQYRAFSITSSRRLASAPPPDNNNNKQNGSSPPTPSLDPKPVPGAYKPEAPPPDSPLANAPRSYGKKTTEFTPTPLSRPIGMNYPPEAGQNSGVDSRSLRQRRDDFVDYDKHLVRRQYLKSKMARPYFRDWRNLRFHKGKTFLSPPRLFKSELSLYFPNLHGRTLGPRPGQDKSAAAAGADTTPLLEGKTSVVALFSGMWAENQVKSFVSPESNPALHEALGRSGGRAQLVRVNVEEDWLKLMIVRLFSGSLRKKIGRENWHRYFIVSKGISDEIRESIGLLNSKVGYVYLVDHQCRIRWAGSGQAEPGEPEGLVKGIRRLLQEMDEEKVGENFVRIPTVGKRTSEQK